MNEPKYKPILFTAPMVRAILEDRKTQTRRLNGLDDVNKIPDAWDAARVTVGALNYKVKKSAKGKYGATFISHPGAIVNNTINVCPQICPYGQPGDRLWVKETYCYHDDLARCLYKADGINSLKWTPSIHMPRWASRITLEITGVRVERLQDISGEDAVTEGCTPNNNGYFWGGPHPDGGLKQMATAVQAYKDLWNSINGPGSWEKNPWVWVVEFKRVEE